MSFHGLGVTEHFQGTFTVMQIADIAMMTGNIGRRGVGVNPLRGQNNVVRGRSRFQQNKQVEQSEIPP
jgi:formate dehydrogenase major subunit